MTREKAILLHPDGPAGDRWTCVEPGLPALYVPVRSKTAVGPAHPQCRSCDCPPPSPQAVRLVRMEVAQYPPGHFPPIYGLPDLFTKDWSGTMFDPLPRAGEVMRGVR